MKILVKPIAVILLGAYSFALGQDVYPYYSDTNKQFEFENRRIYIEEINEKNQVISGGSTFNLMALIDESQPMTIPAPVRTTYYYRYEFHILQNGRNLIEVEFLRLIGLKDEANKILNDFSEKIKIWEKTPPKIDVDQLAKGYCIGSCLILSPIPMIIDTGPYRTLRLLTGGLVAGLGIIVLYQNKGWSLHKPPIPVLEQTLTNEQIKSLAESYNKRIYEEIKNAN